MSISDKIYPPKFKDIYKQASVTLTPNNSNQIKSILITGAQGMLGHGLAVTVKQLMLTNKLSESHLFLASRNWSSDAGLTWKDVPNCYLITNEQIPSVEQQIDLVLHTASPSNITKISSFEELEMANLGILDKILKLHPKKIVYISSGEVYGGRQSNEDTVLGNFSKSKVRDWYPLAKLTSEDELRRVQDDKKLQACVIRLFHTFGPGVKFNDGRSFADVLWGATINNEIILKSKGEQVRTFLYLSDALDGILSIAFNQNIGFSVTNLGSPTSISVYDFANTVANISGAIVRFEETDTFQHSPNKVIVPNLERLIQSGWNEKVSLEDGIRRTIDWIRYSTLEQT
jgi:nucleoside-diphosphate-sugar epimerase